ncbi:MAG: type I DNA topoisomerase, partial [Nostoc sp.]
PTGKANVITERKYETSKTRCPECKNFLAKIPSTKVKKKYFLKCTKDCENVVLFWSDFNKTWQPPQTKAVQAENQQKPPVKMTAYPCPVCKKALEEYSYIKDGQSKTMLRCCDPRSRQDTKHKDV